MKFSRYYLAAVSAFVIWGFFSFALKPLHHHPSLDILFYRVFFSTSVLIALLLIFQRKRLNQGVSIFRSLVKKDKTRVIFLTASGGLLLAANWFFFIYVMNHISIKAASFAYLVCPILTTVLAALILKEKLSGWQWLAVGISASGCVLLSLKHPEDLVYSMIVALSYALYLITQRRNTELDKLVILTFQMVFASLILLPFYPAFHSPLPVDWTFYALIAVIGILFTIIPLYLNLYALKGVNSSTMGILLYLNPLLNFTFAVFYFHEPINREQIISYSLIILSILVFNEQVFFRKNLPANTKKA